MADWLPVLAAGSAPVYRRLADALEADIARGAVRPGIRLPPQRILADRLGLSVGTVTKAYVEAERRGLVRGHVGRGTYVADAGATARPNDGAPINLSLNVIPHHEAARRIGETLCRLTRAGAGPDLLAYAPAAGHDVHRRAAAAWIARTAGYAPDWTRLVVTAGAQHALMLAFAAACRPGDTILCEAASFYGMKSLATFAGYRLRPVAMDGEGIVPEALADAARGGAAAVYVMPSVQNPTGRTMSDTRRAAIVAVARAADLRLVEDDLYAAFEPIRRTRRLAELAPERTFHVSGVSKSLAAGLRTGFLICPDAATFDAAIAATRASVYAPPALGTAVFAAWVTDGTAEAIMAAQRDEIIARFDLARGVVGAWMEPSAVVAPHVWLPMSEVDAERLAGRALRAGVAVTPPPAPIIAAAGISGCRLCIGAPPSRAELARGLEIVRQALAGDRLPAEVDMV